MTLTALDSGYVARLDPAGPAPVACSPRAAVAADGGLVCTYAVQSALGRNDFVMVQTRSADGGATWSASAPIWPQLAARQSITGSISRGADGTLYLYGISIPIDAPGESFWSDATQGMKQNGLFWAVSRDHGASWSLPHAIPMPLPGSAEAPGPLCATRSGRWVACYAPYNTFDPALQVDRGQIVCLRSDDGGQTWQHGSMHRFDEPDAGGAEAWVVELADGRLLGTSWHLDHAGRREYPNAWAVSLDGGVSWTPTRSTGICGQSTGLTPLADGRALFVYNQRKHGPVGVWLAVVRPTDADFGVESNQIAWRAATATQKATTGDHAQWEDFAFGEPSATVLPDSTVLVLFWCVQPDGQGIGYVRLRLS